MAAYVCKGCGADVWAESGREVRTSLQHAKDTGHRDVGLCLPDSPHARQLRGRRPTPGFTTRRTSRPRARRRWDALPLQFRAFVALVVLGCAIVTSIAMSHALDDTPDFLSCKERLTC
ncbi:hypothetical protein [Streptomyces sp. NPDC096132]|uniref:hypothetical protein n=1 Tax=Streptomyces sp. NPDC096132 TaxID=3366075 RepID=UPI0037F49FA0